MENQEKKNILRGLKAIIQFLSKKNVSIPSNCFVHHLTKIKGMQRWKDSDGNYYEWDRLHGHVEVYNSRGKHIFVKDYEGRIIEPGIKGRKINVR